MNLLHYYNGTQVLNILHPEVQGIFQDKDTNLRPPHDSYHKEPWFSTTEHDARTVGCCGTERLHATAL